MKQSFDGLTASQITADIVAETQALPLRNTGSERVVLRKYAKKVMGAEPELIFDIARELITTHGFRWQAYELIQGYQGAFRRVGPIELEAFGQGINSWWSVDSFARTLSGPAWRKGQVPDALIFTWASLALTVVAARGAGQHGCLEPALERRNGRCAANAGGVPPVGCRP